MVLCECGCGAEVITPNKWGRPKRFVVGHNNRGKTYHKIKKEINDNVMIPCGCGCGTFIPKHFSTKQQLKFVKGHQSIGRKYPKDKYPNYGMSGKKHTKETKEKISRSRRGDLNPNKNPKVGRKLSRSLKRLYKTKKGEQLKKQISASVKAYFKTKKGKEQAKKHSKFCSLTNKGHNNPNWKGGLSCLPYSPDFDNNLKDLIRLRDNYLCQLCGKLQIEELNKFNHKLIIHHINYNKLNSLPDNLITVCSSCNSKVNGNRDYWTAFFQKKIEAIDVIVPALLELTLNKISESPIFA